MPTLVLPTRYTNDSIKLWRAATRAGWGVHRMERWDPAELAGIDDLVFYSGFSVVLAEPLGYALIETPLNWLERIPQQYHQREMRFTTLADARGVRERRFFKPADDKSFPARVYNSGAELPGEELLAGTTAVLIAEPVIWEVEFRCFVLDRAVITMSAYSRLGQLNEAADGTWPASAEEAEAASAFATRVITDAATHMPAGFVLDVGVIRGRGWAVIEPNNAWAAGTYGCDADLILPILQRVRVPMTQLTEADRQWLIRRG